MSATSCVRKSEPGCSLPGQSRLLSLAIPVLKVRMDKGKPRVRGLDILCRLPSGIHRDDFARGSPVFSFLGNRLLGSRLHCGPASCTGIGESDRHGQRRPVANQQPGEFSRRKRTRNSVIHFDDGRHGIAGLPLREQQGLPVLGGGGFQLGDSSSRSF